MAGLKLTAICALFYSLFSYGADEGFRYVDGQCLNDIGEVGHNPSYVGQCGDLSGQKFVDQDLSGVDLSGVDLSGAQLQSADFRFSNLDGTVFVGADLSDAVLWANISNANFQDAKLVAAQFFSAEVATNVSFLRADLTGARFNDVKFAMTVFTEANLDQTDIDFRNFTDSQFGHFNQ